jgi:hypothetical protein
MNRGCPNSTVLDFFAMTSRPPGCDVLISNPPYSKAIQFIEHALALEFRVVVLLLKLSFLCTLERFERLHKPGHLRRVHVLAERLQDMHDATFTGQKASQSQVHAWFVLDRDYCGPATISPVSINSPNVHMPWVDQSPSDVAPGSSRVGLRSGGPTATASPKATSPTRSRPRCARRLPALGQNKLLDRD